MSASSGLLALVTAIVALGVGAQVLADRFRVPSALFLVLAGVAVGPAGIDLVAHDSFGDALTTIVGLSVAIIVFEGAFTLDVERIRQTPSTAIRLVTVGAITALLGTALAVRFVLDASWGIALLVGALLVATGPTVVTPILSVVHVRDRVATALETEGIVNDVTAAILAVAVFEAVTLERADPLAFADAFLSRLVIGVLIGAAVAAALWALFRYPEHATRDAPQHARLLVLASAVVAHGSAELITGEAGIAAAATAGLLLGNADLPYEGSIEEFKDDVTLLVLSFVFIVLASLIDFGDLRALGLRGVLVVALVMFVVRPLAVALSTAGEPISRRERVFMSLVAPRGIVPASVATLFALEIQQTDPEAATLLAGTVFLVILVTVVAEAGPARHIADLLGVSLRRVIIVGGGKLGLALAERYAEQGDHVELVESDPERLEAARDAGFSVHQGDGTDPDVLRTAGVGRAKRLVAAADDDETNLRIARLVREEFDVETVVARVSDRKNREAFEDLGVRTLSRSQTDLWAIDSLVDQSLPTWLLAVMREGDVQEVEATSALVGRTVRDLQTELPRRIFLVAVTRAGETFVPDADFRIQRGDRLTLLGRREEVARAVSRYRTTG